MAQDPYKYFRVEARDLLDQFSKGILELEKNGISAPLMQRLLRLAHTLKGAARVVKQLEIADRGHAIEDVLSPLRDSTGAVARAQIDIILSHLDEIGGRVNMLFPPDTAERPVEGQAIRDDPLERGGAVLPRDHDGAHAASIARACSVQRVHRLYGGRKFSPKNW